MKDVSLLKAEAKRLGFSLLGITSLDPPPHTQEYLDWIEQGKHASMAYLTSLRGLQGRLDPRQVCEPAQSVILVAAAYPATASLDVPDSLPHDCGRVAAYAAGSDYHNILPEKLAQLTGFIQSNMDADLQYCLYTDTGPVLERDLAQRAGLGWIGKNTCLIHPQLGSFFFLAEIFVSTPFEPDSPFEQDFCGSCRRCIDACPTGCISDNRTLDARRCISYLTIENRGEIPLELRSQMGGWVFGCDICQQVCPWNKKSNIMPPAAPLFKPDSIPNNLRLSEILRLSPLEFNQRFRHTPIQRAKRRGLLRNAAVAAANLQVEETQPILIDLLQHEQEALIRAHAAWALGQFRSPSSRQALQAARKTELDPIVLAEINAAIAEP